MTSSVPPALNGGFDNELGLTFLEVTPDGGGMKGVDTQSVTRISTAITVTHRPPGVRGRDARLVLFTAAAMTR